jgi:hypothetical protein
VSSVFTGAGAGGTLFTLFGAALRHPPERIAQLALLGQTVGFLLGAIALVAGLAGR